jgi:site-specific DNA recombinase
MHSVIAYGRVSTGNQRDEGTIEIQEQEVMAYCRERDYRLIKFFKDEGVSGGLENRLALAEMLQFLEDISGIHAVIIYKLDRLARDLLVQEHIIKELANRRVRLISIKEPDLDGDDPTRKFMRQIMGGVAELEKAYIRMRLSDGRMNKARKGGYAGGGIPLGYAATGDGDLMIDQTNADTIKLIFKLRRRRMSLHEIARWLNEHSLETARGGKWYARTVKNVLENQLYRGRLAYRDTLTHRPDLVLTGRRQMRIV